MMKLTFSNCCVIIIISYIGIGAMKMFDNKTTHIISIIDNYLQSIGFDTQLLGYANIKKYPDKKALGISFAPATKGNSSGIRYAILIYPTFDNTISVIRNTFESLLKQDSPRAATFNSVLNKDDKYLFIFAFMHEIGHIQHIIDLNVDDETFFNHLTGLNSNPQNNFNYENYADQFSLNHIDKIYEMLNSDNEL